MAKDEAMEMISDLVMAFQTGTKDEERINVEIVCHALCGEFPTREDLRQHIDADY